jgi:site-specific recombinase XerD
MFREAGVAEVDLAVTFLETRRSLNTRRAYGCALRDVRRVTGVTLEELGREHLARWAAEMGERGLTDATINQRLAAVSSWLNFLEEMGGATAPRLSQIRRRVQAYGRSGYLRPDQAGALLRAIDRDTVQGSRDYALFLTFLATGRRSSEIRLLKWRDFVVDGQVCFYAWRGKGKKGGTRELPWECWQAMVDWLNRSGRLEHMGEEDYIFTAISEAGSRLPRMREWRPGQGPLAMQTVGQLLKTYAKRAGIAGRVHVHMLRHSAAMLRKESGEDVLSIQEFLGHSSAAVTQVYLHQLEQRRDVGWGKVKGLLGI